MDACMPMAASVWFEKSTLGEAAISCAALAKGESAKRPDGHGCTGLRIPEVGAAGKANSRQPGASLSEGGV